MMALERLRWTAPLVAVGIQVTNDCNLKCTYCPRDRTGKEYIEFDFYKKIVDELSKCDYKMRLGISYDGEPLLHPDFPEMLEYAVKKKRFQIAFNTNGVYLSRLDKYLSTLARAELKDIIVILSDHGLEPPKQLKYVRRIMLVDAPQYNIQKRIIMWLKLGKPVTVHPCVSDISDDFPMYGQGKVKPYCIRPFTALYIMANGDVKICCHIRADTFIGNIKGKSIWEFWTSPKMGFVRIDTVQNKKPSFMRDCTTCNLWKYGSYIKGRYEPKC